MRHSLLVLLIPFACAAAAQSLTVDQIYSQVEATQPPQGIQWSPDGTRLSYIADNGDLVAVEGGTGTRSVLVEHEKMKALNPPINSEHDRNNRTRYKQASYFWVPDSKHLLFDASGQLWFFDLTTKTGLQIASTGSGSGDDPKFSPDGAYLSYIRDHNLYSFRMKDNAAAVRLTDSQTEHVLDGEVDWVYQEELDVRSNYFWSPDSRRLAYLQSNQTPVPEYPIEDWIPTHATVERQRYPQPGDPNPVVRIGVVNANGGKTRWINIPIDNGSDYIPRFGWLNNKTVWVETLKRDHKKLSLYFADISTDETKEVLTQTDTKFFDESYDLTFFASNFLLTSWRDGHNHIYLYRFDGGNPLSAEATLVKQLTSGDWEVAGIAGVNQQAQTVYYLSNEGDPRQQQIWVVGLNGEGKRQVSRHGDWHEPIFSPNTNFFADTVSSAATPPVLDLCRHQNDCQTLWKAPPLSAPLTPPIDVEWKAADGMTTLYGRLLLPPGKTTPASVPLITNPYGGPHAQLVTGQWDGRERLFDQVLVENGFAVLHVDNRGMGGRGRAFAQAAYNNFGPVQLGDQITALDQTLHAYPQLDPKRLGWWGWSWGGSFTLYALTHSDRFRAGVAGAPVTDWQNYDSIYTERYLGQPALNSDVYRDDSVLNSAANLKGRLLLLQGTGDDNVHMENTIQFIQKLIDADLPYDLQLYPRKTHGIDGESATTHLYRAILGSLPPVSHAALIATLTGALMILGEMDLSILTDGTYLLDGGAMFGVVPKPLWEKRVPANEKNQIVLGTNTVLVRTGKHTVVIETGIGNKLPQKLRGIYDARQLLMHSFHDAGVRPEEVDIVINTHLHFDHCGWNTTRMPDGSIVPTFPNARYFVHRGEVEHGHLQLDRDAVSYISDNYDPLIANGQMTMLDGDAEIVPGVRVEVFPGHTAQMMAVMLESAGKRACYISDLIPTSAHLDVTWVTGYDLDPLASIEQRKRFLSRAIPEHWLVLFTHDHNHPMGYVQWGAKGKPEFVEATP